MADVAVTRRSRVGVTSSAALDAPWWVGGGELQKKLKCATNYNNCYAKAGQIL